MAYTSSARLGALLVLALMIAAPALAKKEDHGVWNLNVQFVNASAVVDEAVLQGKIADWIAKAESIYQRRPQLKIKHEIVRASRKDGKDLSAMIFDSLGQYASYMDKNFDNVAVTKTEGHMTVLITDKLCVGEYASGTNKGQPKCWGGYAHFPHWVNPFSKKRGITLVSGVDDFTFSHELGHVFGLKHTFEPYVGLNLQCNKGYKPKGRPEGECNSCAGGNIIYDADGNPSRCQEASNLMDYCTSVTHKEFLNPCQEERAANQRYTYMTADGETNYFKLKGLAGEPICKEDADCEQDRYCDKGTITLGRNQCVPKKDDNEACDLAGGGHQCKSGHCKFARCYTPESVAMGGACYSDDACKDGKCSAIDGAKGTCVCKSDADCGPDKWCNAGADLTKNSCQSLKDDNEPCDLVGGGHQCKSGQCRFSRCYTPGSVAMGGTCYNDDACKDGKCSAVDGAKGTCVCKSDADCGPDKWCNAGADLTKNSCQSLKDDNEPCDLVGGGHQCKSGQCRFSRCYTPGSVAMGGTCYNDDACKDGKCSAVDGAKGTCVCKNDADCGSGKWCDAGLDLKKNSCKNKLNNGASCGKAGSFGNDHKCKSGKCSGFPNYKCK